MTNEDYKKYYEETLERAKVWQQHLYESGDKDYADELNYIFPELKESEDEKIRKAIHIYLDWLDGRNKDYQPKGDYTIRDMIAWLEKQGEKLPVGFYYVNSEGKKFYSDTFKCGDFTFHVEKQSEKKPVDYENQETQNGHKFNIGDIISNGNVTYRVDNIVKNCIGQDCYFLVNIEDEKNGNRYLILTDPKGNTHYTGETTWLCEQVDAKFEKQGEHKPAECSRVPLREIVLNVWELGNIWKEITKGVCNTEHGTQLEFIIKHWNEGEHYTEWLEKQGEQKTNKYEGYCKDCNNIKGCVTCVDGNQWAHYKEVEQKPTEIKPKFKEGDWVVQDCNILKIRCVGDEYYCFETVGGYVAYMLVSEIDSLYHLWTIQDAKDGDVLIYEGEIFMIKFYALWNKIVYHCCYDGKILHKYSIYDSWRKEDFDKVHPATKEQRDTLMKAMTYAGYTFDFEKKELKKIDLCSGCTNDKGCINCENGNLKETEKSAWSEEDEKMIESALQFAHEYGRHGLWFWLKLLKDRVQPKQEWSENDKEQLDRAIYMMGQLGLTKSWDDVYNWLKSLKDRI